VLLFNPMSMARSRPQRQERCEIFRRCTMVPSVLFLVYCAVAFLSVATLYTVTDLGMFPSGSSSWAYGMNASGQVGGDAYTASSCGHALLCRGSGPIRICSSGGCPATQSSAILRNMPLLLAKAFRVSKSLHQESAPRA
jgi:hypothetical protein